MGDGYLWEYLYEIPADVSINRCTNEYIVVPWPEEIEESPARWGFQNNLTVSKANGGTYTGEIKIAYGSSGKLSMGPLRDVGIRVGGANGEVLVIGGNSSIQLRANGPRVRGAWKDKNSASWNVLLDARGSLSGIWETGFNLVVFGLSEPSKTSGYNDAIFEVFFQLTFTGIICF
ncbi:hypothetical protein vBKpnAMK6_00457 [Klebsiella phage vB_Kpn_AM_K6]